jgi:PIN domain nuclease of toxin-antitoxin system
MGSQTLISYLCQLPMAAIVHSALGVKWTREPGDRIIVANAIANNEAPLITSDRRIAGQYRNAIW